MNALGILDHHLVAALIGAIIALVIARGLRRWQFNTRNKFDVQDLLMENGRTSRGACVMMGAFVATSWFFVYYALIGKMTEGYFGLYAGVWIAPVVARMITNAPVSLSAPATTTTTTTETKSA